MTITILNITLTVRGPFITQSSAPMDYGIDAALARNKDNLPYVPGTLLTGKLREAWLELEDLTTEKFQPHISDWLGEESLETTVLPKPKRLYINDLVLTNTEEKAEINYRIRLDPKRGTVEKGAYLVTERPFAPGDTITFQGTARFLARDEIESQDLIRHLEIGLKWLSQVGADRTVGFGELIDVNIEPEPLKSVETHKLPASDTYDFIISPESPFCISEHHIAGNNLFNSSNFIPGGVIKGTLANLWTTLFNKKIVDKNLDSKRQELGEYFDKIKFTHAFPGYSQIRPTIAPLSLVKADDFYDVALCDGAGLINGEAPAFAVDWKGKDYAKVDEMFGMPYVKRELRVRTKINSEKRRSDDEQLFAYEMVVPTEYIAWYGSLDLSELPEDERTQVIEQLQSLIAQGLIGLGKTKTYAEIELLESNSITPCHCSNIDLRDGVWILSLQTSALLCNPDLLISEKNSHSLHQAYATVFQEMSDNSLEMRRFFATQSMAGGFYLWKRFQEADNYQPYLLTNQGSVFVLQPKDGQETTAKKFIEKWSKTGLPLPNWAIEKYKRDGKNGDHWSNCSYIPQNGYGEIAVNLSVHWDNKPKKFVLIQEGGEK